MHRGTALGLLIVGITLLIWGVDASNSFSSSVSNAVNGAPSDKAIWLIAAGVVLSLGGLTGLLRGRIP